MTKEVLKLALEALKHVWNNTPDDDLIVDNAITAIKEALAQPEHEPFAWFHYLDFRMIHHEVWLELIEGQGDWIPLYTTTPQRTWVNATTWRGLTSEEIRQLEKENTVNGYHGDYCPTWDLIQATEDKLKEKNT